MVYNHFMFKKQHYKIVSGSRITSKQLEAFAKFEELMFPLFPPHLNKNNKEHRMLWEKECGAKGVVPWGYSGADFWRKIYEESKEGLHLLLGKKGRVVGCFATTRPSAKKLEIYLHDHDYSKLDNALENENEYLFSLALLSEHRNCGAVKILAGSYAEQLISLEKRGIKTTRIIGEAVSLDGHKSMMAMGMEPITPKVLKTMGLKTFKIDALDGQGHGFHYSPDNLHAYKIKMSAWKKRNHSNCRFVQLFLDIKNKTR